MPEEASPKDPMTSLAEGAAGLHELYSTYVTAGFNMDQALYLVGVTLRALMNRSPGE